MKVKLPGHQARIKERLPIWKQMAALVNGGTPVDDVAGMFTNPETGKPYTRGGVYNIIKRLNTLTEL